MGVDYYNMLRVNRNSTDEDLKKVYKKLAMKWHPYKNSDSEAEHVFNQISLAHDVLSDPIKCQIYDLYGEEALKVNRRVEEDNIIGELFGGSGDFANTQQPRRSLTGFGSGGKKMAAVENLLECSLEELYKG